MPDAHRSTFLCKEPPFKDPDFHNCLTIRMQRGLGYSERHFRAYVYGQQQIARLAMEAAAMLDRDERKTLIKRLLDTL